MAGGYTLVMYLALQVGKAFWSILSEIENVQIAIRTQVLFLDRAHSSIRNQFSRISFFKLFS